MPAIKFNHSISKVSVFNVLPSLVARHIEKRLRKTWRIYLGLGKSYLLDRLRRFHSIYG